MDANEKNNSTIIKNNNIKENEKSNIIIGKNQNNKEIFIAETSRYLNLAILGKKGTGKTTYILPALLKQDLKNKNIGATIIVSEKDMSYYIYTLCKQYNRKVIFIKPSINCEVENTFLWKNEYEYDYINETIIDYKQAIKNKAIVIIDMEPLKYRDDAYKATAMLLLQLQLDMQETDITENTPHFLYIDSAVYYIPFIEQLLIFGGDYNIATILLLQSRNFLSKLKSNNKNYLELFDNNVCNLILLNNLNSEDIDFYKKTMPEQLKGVIDTRKNNEIYYNILKNDGTKSIGDCTTSYFNNNETELIIKTKKNKEELLRNKYKMVEETITEQLLEKNKSKDVKEQIPIEDTEFKKEVKDEIIKAKKQKDKDVNSKLFNDMIIDIEICKNDFTVEFK